MIEFVRYGMNFSIKLLQFHISTNTFWVRIPARGKGIHFSRTRMLFSERSGHVKTRPLIFGWRFKVFNALGDKVV